MIPPIQPKPTVHVVDDDSAVRGALETLLQIEGYAVRTFASGLDLLDAARDLGPGCVVMDVRMPGLDGTRTQARLRLERPDLRVILITGDGDVPLAVRALKDGASDFLEKPFEPQALLDSVRLALRDRPEAGFGRAAAAAKLRRLTAREHEVLERLVAGDTNKAIARRLGASPRTIEIHRARVMAKLSANSMAETVRIALNAGIEPR